MKRFSKSIVAFLMIISLVLLASCGKNDKDNKDDDNNGSFPGGNINTEGGLEGPIIPWD
jgi:major membrane immunogen (membrane-anchored lipoprotein)